MAIEKRGIEDEIIDNLLKDYKEPEDLIGENGLLKQLTKRLLERAMSAEMTEHVGYEKHAAEGRGSGNSRQREDGEDAERDVREITDRGAEGQERDVRAEDRGQASDAIHGL